MEVAFQYLFNITSINQLDIFNSLDLEITLNQVDIDR